MVTGWCISSFCIHAGEITGYRNKCSMGGGGGRTHMNTELYRTSIKLSLNLYNPWEYVSPSLPVNPGEMLGTSSLTAFQSQFKDWALYQGHNKFYKCDYRSCLPPFQVNNNQRQHNWYFTCWYLALSLIFSGLSVTTCFLFLKYFYTRWTQYLFLNFYVVLRIELSALHVLGKHPTNWDTAPAQ